MSQEVRERVSEPVLLAAKLFAEFVNRRSPTPARDFEALCAAPPESEREQPTSNAPWEQSLAVLPQPAVPSPLVAGVPGTNVPRAELPAIEALRRHAARRDAASRYSIQGEVARGGMGAILRVW